MGRRGRRGGQGRAEGRRRRGWQAKGERPAATAPLAALHFSFGRETVPNIALRRRPVCPTAALPRTGRLRRRRRRRRPAAARGAGRDAEGVQRGHRAARAAAAPTAAELRVPLRGGGRGAVRGAPAAGCWGWGRRAAVTPGWGGRISLVDDLYANPDRTRTFALCSEMQTSSVQPHSPTLAAAFHSRCAAGLVGTGAPTPSDPARLVRAPASVPFASLKRQKALTAEAPTPPFRRPQPSPPLVHRPTQLRAVNHRIGQT